MLRYVPVLLEIALTVYCLIDAIQTDKSEIRNLPRIVWIMLILLLPVVGDVAWLLAGRPTRASLQGRTQQQRWEERRRPRGPDDDPDFLKDI